MGFLRDTFLTGILTVSFVVIYGQFRSGTFELISLFCAFYMSYIIITDKNNVFSLK